MGNDSEMRDIHREQSELLADQEREVAFQQLPEIVQELVERSGLNAKLIESGVSDETFEHLLIAMSMVRQGKEALYGSFIANKKGESEGFALMGHFVDMRRKWIRAQNFVSKKYESGENFDIEELLDTYLDLAVYSVLGVQLIKAIREGDL